MSLGVAVNGLAGIVLAAETRLTLAVRPKAPGSAPVPVVFDNAPKLLTLGRPHRWVAAVTYGDATIGRRTAQSNMPGFESTLGSKRRTIREYAAQLGRLFGDRWNEAYMPPATPR